VTRADGVIGVPLASHVSDSACFLAGAAERQWMKAPCAPTAVRYSAMLGLEGFTMKAKRIKPGDGMPVWAIPYATRRLYGQGGNNLVHLCIPDGGSTTLCGRNDADNYALAWDSEYEWRLCGRCAALARAEDDTHD
jgi:hypothetical protein